MAGFMEGIGSFVANPLGFGDAGSGSWSSSAASSACPTWSR